MSRLLILLLAVTLSVPVFAQDFTVKEFSADFFINSEGYVDVVEKYDVEFTAEMHGIYRDIPLKSKIELPNSDKTQRIRIKISDIEVPGHEFTFTRPLFRNIFHELNIKIGDPNKYVRGRHQYEIRYRIDHVLAGLEDSDVLFYWNVRGSDWNEPFEKVKFSIHAPEGVNFSEENSFVYVGSKGEDGGSYLFDYTYDGNKFTAESSGETFEYVNKGYITVLNHIPANLVNRKPYPNYWWSEFGWITILILLLLGGLRLWFIHGKDDKAVAVTSYYPPPGIDPSMAHYMLKDFNEAGNLVCLLPYWASQGLIKIKEVKPGNILSLPDVEFTRLKDLPPDRPAYQRLFFEELFKDSDGTVLARKLNRTKMTKMMKEARKELKKSLEPYYLSKSEELAKKMRTFGLFAMLILGVVFLFVWGLIPALVAFYASSFFLVLSFLMKKKNSDGNRIYSELLGFKNFVKLSEVNKLEYLNSQDSEYFSKTAAYAMIFGSLRKWSKAFASIGAESPSWYVSSSGSVVGMQNFNSSFTKSMAVVGVSTGGGSGGGGSAGGGAGGGGGGGW